MDQWTCKHCGEKNDADCDFCFGCGEFVSEEKARIKRQPNRPRVELGEPHDDPLFGALYWDATSKEWTGIFPADAEFPFKLAIEPESNPSRTIGPDARRVMQHIVSVLPTLTKTVAAAMLGEVIEWAKGSDEWDEAYEKLTPEEFARMLFPDTIWLRADGSGEVSFIEDEILGHWIVADVSASGEVAGFRMEG